MCYNFNCYFNFIDKEKDNDKCESKKFKIKKSKLIICRRSDNNGCGDATRSSSRSCF